MLGSHGRLIPSCTAMKIRALPELQALERIIELGGSNLESHVVGKVELPGIGTYPLLTVAMGSKSRDAPAVGYFGGVTDWRGSAQKFIAYLHNLVMRLQWDSTLHRQLDGLRLVFIPIVNPGGMVLGTGPTRAAST